MMSVSEKLKLFWNKCRGIFFKTTRSTSISFDNNKPKEKTAHELFQLIFDKWLRSLSASLGYNIMDSKFKIGVHTIFTLTMIFSLFVCCMFTTLTYHSEMAWKSSACLSLCLQVLITKIDFGSNLFINVFVFQGNGKIILPNQTSSADRIFGEISV